MDQDPTTCMILEGSENSNEAVRSITRSCGAKDRPEEVIYVMCYITCVYACMRPFNMFHRVSLMYISHIYLYITMLVYLTNVVR